jgi:hypothetical protein
MPMVEWSRHAGHTKNQPTTPRKTTPNGSVIASERTKTG